MPLDDLMGFVLKSEIKNMKAFRNSKIVVAAMLHYLIPGFEDMSIEEIVKECLDPVSSDELFMNVYSEPAIFSDTSFFKEELIFIIKLPESLREKFGSDELLLYLELQNGNVHYLQQHAISLYDTDRRMYKAPFLGLEITTHESDKKIIPVISIWTYLNQNENDSYITEVFSEQRIIEAGGKTVNKTITSPYPNLVIVNIGNPVSPESSPIIQILDTIYFGSMEEVKQTLISLGAKQNEEGEVLVLKEVTTEAYKQGFKVGLDEARRKRKIEEFMKWVDEKVQEELKKLESEGNPVDKED